MSIVYTLFSKLFDFLIIIGVWILDGLWFVIGDVLYLIYDGLLTAIYGIVAALDLGQLVVDGAALWAGLPGQMLYCINQIGLPQGLAMLSYALTIRMILNIIPASWTRI